jgi:hypothetical protein
VERVAEGRARIVGEGADELVVEIDFGGGWRVLRGRRVEGDRWVFAPAG